MRTRLLVVLLTLAAVLAGCQEPDPEAELAQAVDRTLDGSFAYEVALETAGDAGQDQAGALLQGLQASGSRDGDSWSLAVSMLGFEVVDVRVIGPELRHVRLGFGQVLGLLGGPEADLGAEIARELSSRGEDEETVETARAALDGDWLTVEGPLSAEDLARALGDAAESEDGDPAAIARVLGQDVREFVDRYVVIVDQREEDGRTVYEVEVDAGALARALEEADPDDPGELSDIDDRYPGTIVVRDGVVHEAELRVGGDAEDDGAAGDDGDGDADGTLRLRATLEGHGEVPPIEPPEGARTVTSERFLEAVRALSELFSESPPQVP